MGRLNRRQFVFTAATFALLGGCGVRSNLGKPVATGVARVGILNGALGTDASSNELIAGLKQGLAELGYMDGKTIVFGLSRLPVGTVEPMPELASEFIRLPVDVLVSLLTGQTLAARQATTVIPIVFVAVTDPVGQGFVASLAHPGGNLTGVSNEPATAFGKQLEFLAQLVPRLSRVAIVLDVSNSGDFLRLQATATAANDMGVQLKVLDVRSPEDVEPALAEALAWQAEAVMESSGNTAISGALARFLDFQVQNRIPMALSTKPTVQAGGLLSYDTSRNEMGRTAAVYVDKIIKGAKPADLPVEQPTVYELVINRTTAAQLGLSIPNELAVQVTQWVQ
jgi:ABC-type uncharacterized transport system substrate-binding protein